MKLTVSLADDFLSILFPRVCHACGDHLVRNETLICSACHVAIPKTGFHLRRDNYAEKLFWGRCRLEKAAAWAYYVKSGRMTRLIYRFKYNGIREIGSELGRIYGIALTESGFMDDIDIIVPVPLHRRKERRRGFNQSLVLADAIAAVSGKPVNSCSLTRVTKTETQTVRSRIERWKNVEGIFAVEDGSSLQNSHVLLVDDVITTGSTIDACTTALSNIEGIRVSAVAMAVALLE
jgi:ComF family protein